MENLIAYLILGFMLLLTYIGFHMACEKDAGKYIPLLWEKGGALNKTYHKLFNKSDVKYRDGDNT